MGGLPHSTCASLVPRGLALPALFVVCAALGIGAAPHEAANRPVRIRIEWTAPKPEVWAGVLEASQGVLVHPASLSLAADQAGTLWPDGKSLWLGRRSPCLDDGFDVTVMAKPSARICFTLQNAVPGGWRRQFEWNLAEIGLQTRIYAFGDRDGHLSVRRAPGDALRVAVDRPHLIYHPGETFRATLLPGTSLSGISSATKPAGGRSLKWQVCLAQTGKMLQQGSLPLPLCPADRSDARIPIEVPLPRAEGVLDLGFRLEGFTTHTPEAVVQIVVMADQLPSVANRNRDAVLVDHFRPADGDANRPVDYGLRLPCARSDREHRVGPAVGSCVSKEPAAYISPVNWAAYRLELTHPNRAHRLVVEMPADKSELAGFSVFDTGGANGPTSFATVSGLAVGGSAEWSSEDSSTARPMLVRREMLFWPRVREPVLMLHGLGAGRPVETGKVEVYELGALTASSRLPKSDSREERLVGPYMSRPAFVEGFGAPQPLDSVTRRGVDTWESFFVAALRLADYLHWNGDNSLMLAVFAEGSTIYPSALLEPSPRFDSGLLSSSGQDPMRKDVVELLYRVFDREGLLLIPELQFSSRLPALERKLAAGESAVEGIELVGPDGEKGPAPCYNPLDPRVQSAVLDVVREFVERYRGHTSFRGIAVEVDRSGYLQLPGLEWGCDDTTLVRFQHDTGLPSDDGSADSIRNDSGKDRSARRRELLTGEGRSRWIAWRCAELAKFYRRLADVVASAGPRSRLVLACKEVHGSNSDIEIRREIRTRGHFGDLIRQQGLDFSLLENVPRLVVLRPAIWRMSNHPQDNLLDDAMNDSAWFRSAFRGPETGVLSLHCPQEVRVSGIAAGISPSGQATVRLCVHASASAQEERRRFVRALGSSDAQMIFDGGWRVPFVPQEGNRSARQIMRALPRISFFKVEGDDQPAIVRVARREKKTYIYTANEFPQPIQLTIQLTCPAATAVRPLGPSPSVAIEADGGASRLAVALDGYGLAAWEIEHEDVRVENVRAELTPSGIASLQAQIRKFAKLADMRHVKELKSVQTTRPKIPAGPAVAGEANMTDQPRVEPSGEEERPVSGAAYWSLDRNGSRIAQTGNIAPAMEPLSADDLRQLAKISLEISLAWEEKRFAECQRLLDSYWCRDVLMDADQPSSKAALREALASPKDSAAR